MMDTFIDHQHHSQDDNDDDDNNEPHKTTQIVIENEEHQLTTPQMHSNNSNHICESKMPDNKGTEQIARLNINSKTLKAWDKGKRPSLFTAIEKLKLLRNNAHQREQSSGHTPSNSISFSEDKHHELSVSNLLQDNHFLEEPSPSLTPQSGAVRDILPPSELSNE